MTVDSLDTPDTPDTHIVKRPLRVAEIFYSIQGEGGRAGIPSLFVRLQGCSAQWDCSQLGVQCDTEFRYGHPLTLPEVHTQALAATGGKFVPIIWTGGEPLDQLSADYVVGMKSLGWPHHAIETSGKVGMSTHLRVLLDWVCVSPKVSESRLKENFLGIMVDELRYVVQEGQALPTPALKARRYTLSPHFDGADINQRHVAHAVRLCLDNPTWQLSLQLHKWIQVP